MSEVSGPQWCARFPGSTSPDDLVDPFRGRVWAFLSAMHKGGAGVTIGATYRPPERAYLMHWCCLIADSGQSPAAVPHMEGVDIDWAHGGDADAAKAAAHAMKTTYGIQFPAALVSRHTQRRAIDMDIAWSGTLDIRDYNGVLHHISSTPRDGSNADLVHVGASFSVIKLLSDPPHWSDDGH